MKKLKLLVTILITAGILIACDNSRNSRPAENMISTAEMNIYYFHFTQRCATCMAVEKNARLATEALYPNEISSGTYSFSSVNLVEALARELADKLEVGGQALIVVRGDRKIDITSEAWMAAHDPDKMKTEIKSAVDKVLF